MKCFLIAIVLACAVCIRSELLDDYDFESLVNNEEQFKAAYKCLMEQGPCDDYQQIKETLPKLVETACGECKPEQKEKYEKVSKLIFEKYPKEFEEVMKKFGKAKQE